MRQSSSWSPRAPEPANAATTAPSSLKTWGARGRSRHDGPRRAAPAGDGEAALEAEVEDARVRRREPPKRGPAFFFYGAQTPAAVRVEHAEEERLGTRLVEELKDDHRGHVEPEREDARRAELGRAARVRRGRPAAVRARHEVARRLARWLAREQGRVALVLDHAGAVALVRHEDDGPDAPVGRLVAEAEGLRRLELGRLPRAADEHGVEDRIQLRGRRGGHARGPERLPAHGQVFRRCQLQPMMAARRTDGRQPRSKNKT